MNADAPADQPTPTTPTPRRERRERPEADRSPLARAWYKLVKAVATTSFAAFGGWRTSGFENMPAAGGVILVSNHLSYLDVFILGMGVRRPLNYIAR